MNKEQQRFLYVFLSLFGISILGQILNFFHVVGHYHEFVDVRNLFKVNNFFDTVSNVGFLIVGIIFIKEISIKSNKDINLMMVAVGSILVFFGSSYYHLLPDDSRLFWDRLPISMVFSGILSYSLHANNLINKQWEKIFNVYYFLFSIGSVVFWNIGVLNNQNWLGPYVFIQFGGMLTLIYIILTGKNKEFNKKIIAVLAWYVLAKLCEHLDGFIYEITENLISGHTLKHIFSAVALYIWFPKEVEKIN